MSEIKRFDIYLIDLNPTKGSKISKIRPCIVISPDEMNDILKSGIVAPYTSTIKEFYPFRLNSNLNNQLGQIAFDRIKCVDKSKIN
ncbi:MAG: type II toxin-antitoxin system PemK/MazF family toxin [Bacteroidota bacterium]|nr:type II toxin-antitoxin system PemK/MazF family toxin [Bacteroidota bacterium]